MMDNDMISKSRLIAFLRDEYGLTEADEDTGEETELDVYVSSADFLDSIRRYHCDEEDELHA